MFNLYNKTICDFFYNDQLISYSARESTIDNIKTFIVYENKHDENCAICSEIYQVQDIIKALSCGHVFHSTCINTWLLSNDTCPLCRKTCIRTT